MLSQTAKKFIVQIQYSCRPLFQGRYLLLTNTVTGGGLLALGDTLQQSREISSEPGRVRDWKRTGSMFLVGCSMGPPQHYWYGLLDKVFVGAATNMVVKKILVDQVMITPLIGLWYFIGMGLMEGHTINEAWTDFKDKFWEYVLADWCVWSVAQTINFYFLSPKFRVLYINIVGLGWDTYLSYLLHRDNLPVKVSEARALDVPKLALLPSATLKEKA